MTRIERISLVSALYKEGLDQDCGFGIYSYNLQEIGGEFYPDDWLVILKPLGSEIHFIRKIIRLTDMVIGDGAINTSVEHPGCILIH